jgi:hypothetical protein
MNERIEKALYKRGLVNRDVRVLVRNQLYVAGVSAAGAILAGWLVPGVWHFAAGALLMTWNFTSLVKFVQQVLFLESHKGVVLGLLRFMGRLLLSGAVIFALLAYAHASVGALVAGLSTVVANLALWGGRQVIEHKAKEA